jgi:flagella basal body P-ring formation protein FlgA
MGNSAPRLPLTFELRAVDAQASTIRATLAVSLQREVWLASRRLRKGSKVACADFSLERRDIRAVPQSALPVSCELGADVVALHDIAARDVVQSVDFGAAPDVAAGAPVRVSVVNGPISVSTTAIALADAKVGDQIPVRLNRPVRTLKGRVTAPGAVQLGDSAP